MAAFVDSCKAMRGNGVEPIPIIGQGGMGAVYKRAMESKTASSVEVMRRRPPMVVPSQRFHRFKREARLLKQLSHPM